MKTEKPKIEKKEIKKERVFDPGFEYKSFKIPDDIQAELDAKGLEGRYVSIKKLGRHGNRHPRGWQPYKTTNAEVNLLTGESSDGYIYHGNDSVLAVKTKEQVADHRKLLRQNAESSSVKNMIKRNRKKFRDQFKDIGSKGVIIDDKY